MESMSEATSEPGPIVLGQGLGGEVFVLTDNSDGSDEQVTEPAKVMRIGRMISRLLDEVKDAPLDDASRARLREIYAQSIDELAGGLDEGLAEELRRITTPFAADWTPSDAELRIAQAQLVGWLEGLFQGLQTAMVAQHLNAAMKAGTPAIPQSAPELPAGAPGGGMYL
jgi:hypothetical protein